MTQTLEQKDKFLRNQKAVEKAVRQAVKKEGGIIYGARSVNRQVKPHLRTHTEDFDIFVKKNPKQFARKIEKKLDKRFGGNYYEVKSAIHPGTEKVMDRISGKGTADVSKHPKGKIKVVRRKGVKYAHTDFQKRQIKKSLADPKSKFRHEKDKFSRLRIQLNERKPKRKPKKIKKSYVSRARKVGTLPRNAFAMPKLRMPF